MLSVYSYLDYLKNNKKRRYSSLEQALQDLSYRAGLNKVEHRSDFKFLTNKVAELTEDEKRFLRNEIQKKVNEGVPLQAVINEFADKKDDYKREFIKQVYIDISNKKEEVPLQFDSYESSNQITFPFVQRQDLYSSFMKTALLIDSVQNELVRLKELEKSLQSIQEGKSLLKRPEEIQKQIMRQRAAIVRLVNDRVQKNNEQFVKDFNDYCKKNAIKGITDEIFNTFIDRYNYEGKLFLRESQDPHDLSIVKCVHKGCNMPFKDQIDINHLLSHEDLKNEVIESFSRGSLDFFRDGVALLISNFVKIGPIAAHDQFADLLEDALESGEISEKYYDELELRFHAIETPDQLLSFLKETYYNLQRKIDRSRPDISSENKLQELIASYYLLKYPGVASLTSRAYELFSLVESKLSAIIDENAYIGDKALVYRIYLKGKRDNIAGWYEEDARIILLQLKQHFKIPSDQPIGRLADRAISVREFQEKFLELYESRKNIKGYNILPQNITSVQRKKVRLPMMQSVSIPLNTINWVCWFDNYQNKGWYAAGNNKEYNSLMCDNCGAYIQIDHTWQCPQCGMRHKDQIRENKYLGNRKYVLYCDETQYEDKAYVKRLESSGPFASVHEKQKMLIKEKYRQKREFEAIKKLKDTEIDITELEVEYGNRNIKLTNTKCKIVNVERPAVELLIYSSPPIDLIKVGLEIQNEEGIRYVATDRGIKDNEFILYFSKVGKKEPKLKRTVKVIEPGYAFSFDVVKKAIDSGDVMCVDINEEPSSIKANSFLVDKNGVLVDVNGKHCYSGEVYQILSINREVLFVADKLDSDDIENGKVTVEKANYRIFDKEVLQTALHNGTIQQIDFTSTSYVGKGDVVRDIKGVLKDIRDNSAEESDYQISYITEYEVVILDKIEENKVIKDFRRINRNVLDDAINKGDIVVEDQILIDKKNIIGAGKNVVYQIADSEKFPAAMLDKVTVEFRPFRKIEVVSRDYRFVNLNDINNEIKKGNVRFFNLKPVSSHVIDEGFIFVDVMGYVKDAKGEVDKKDIYYRLSKIIRDDLLIIANAVQVKEPGERPYLFVKQLLDIAGSEVVGYFQKIPYENFLLYAKKNNIIKVEEEKEEEIVKVDTTEKCNYSFEFLVERVMYNPKEVYVEDEEWAIRKRRSLRFRKRIPIGFETGVPSSVAEESQAVQKEKEIMNLGLELFETSFLDLKRQDRFQRFSADMKDLYLDRLIDMYYNELPDEFKGSEEKEKKFKLFFKDVDIKNFQDAVNAFFQWKGEE